MANPLTVEQRIHIAASFDSEKIKMIRELMEEEAIDFWKFCINKGYRLTLASKNIYAIYQQNNKANKQ